MPSFGIKELLHGKMPTPFIHTKLTRALLCLGKMSSFYLCFLFIVNILPTTLTSFLLQAYGQEGGELF